ncbi:Do-like 8, chloroplastic [Seminavis robusta]|uniref:Do-like 8, chloroplastic n=1 Tax=Seminavis robusta TaxID=568900 RepID=A0A9N8HRR4_9STRA|nr:Do-like 8, chloroplastic [Seminavis robusta]|eukprot:Sro1351_g265220.1 Do-like 8, chloroplastic (505) ;mRNA; r:11393-13323
MRLHTTAKSATLLAVLLHKDAIAFTTSPTRCEDGRRQPRPSFRTFSPSHQLSMTKNTDDGDFASNTRSINDNQRRALLAGIGGLAATLGLQPEPANALLGGGATVVDAAEARRIEVFEKVAPSVVFIDTFTERRDVFTTNVMEVPLGTGSGFVWDNDGHIVTNFHVVRDAKFAQVAILTKGGGGINNKPQPRLTSATQNPFETPPTSVDSVLPYTSMRPNSDASRSVYKARVVGVDPSKDIAVLKVDAPKNELFPISVGTSTGIKTGQQALAIGNPFGLDHTLTAGIISGVGREVRSPIGRPISNVIQTDCAINPGNSGGPLLDSSGKLIGMNTAIYSPSGASSGIGFAIPADTVKFIAETLIRDGQVVRPVLGISYLESKQAKALGIQSGVLVLDVPEDSAAYRAGMRGTRRTESGLIELGDILSKVGDTVINTESDLFRALENYKPGDKIDITVNRVSVDPTSTNTGVTLKELKITMPLQSSVDIERKMNLYSAPPRLVPQQ